jgi:hypothetical protein
VLIPGFFTSPVGRTSVLVLGFFTSPVVRTIGEKKYRGKYHEFLDMSNTEVLNTELIKTPETNTEVLTTGLVQKTRGLTLRF